jgi:hypothetical protein
MLTAAQRLDWELMRRARTRGLTDYRSQMRRGPPSSGW